MVPHGCAHLDVCLPRALCAEGGVYYTDQQFHPIGTSEDGVTLTHAQALLKFEHFIRNYQESGGRLMYL